MTESENTPLLPEADYKKVTIIAVATVIILTLITVGAYSLAKKRSGVTVLPGGTTYLGPSTAPTSPPPPPKKAKFTVSPDTAWLEFKGISHPYSFSYPSTLKFVTFPKDPTESFGIVWQDIPPQSNIMFRINDIKLTEPSMVQYINKPKIEYAKNWWKQYPGGLKGVATVTEFTNSKGMKGYKAKYINHANETPNDDIFFEIPGRPDLMVRFGNGWLEKEVFDRIVDSFYWAKPAAKPTEIPETPNP